MESMGPDRIAGAELVASEFGAAWNAHDIERFDRLFTDDAVWVAVAESRVAGRPQIVEDFRDIHSSWAQATTVVNSDVATYHARPDVAIVVFHAGYLDDAGAVLAGVDRAMMLVAVHDSGTWKVAAGQVTKQSAMKS